MGFFDLLPKSNKREDDFSFTKSFLPPFLCFIILTGVAKYVGFIDSFFDYSVLLILLFVECIFFLLVEAKRLIRELDS